MASGSTSLLVRMPREVLIRITSFLSTTDLLAVRLTCKDLEDGLLKSFAHEYFHKKQFMLSNFSLRTLLDIADHATFGPYLRHLIISTNHFQRPRAGFLPDSPELALNMFMAYASQFVFLSAGHDQLMLAHVFTKLRNLETVDIRDFNSENRTRDDPAGTRTSYGVNTAQQHTGLAMVQATSPGLTSTPTQDYLSRVFISVLYALGVAQARPTSLEVMARSSPGLIDCALYIHDEMKPSILPVLANLKVLHLDLYFTVEGHKGNPMLPILPPGLPSPALQQFLSSTPNLTWLRLNFVADTRTHTTDTFLLWLATPVDAASTTNGNPSATAPQPPVALSNLERLDLGRVSLHARTLHAVVRKFSPSLRHLSLRRVTLVAFEDNGDDDVKKLWPHLFENLARLAPNLRALNVDMPFQGVCAGHRHSFLYPQVLPLEFAVSGGVAFRADANMSMDRFLAGVTQAYKDFETAKALEAMKTASSGQEDDTDDDGDDDDDSEEEDEDEEMDDGGA